MKNVNIYVALSIAIVVVSIFYSYRFIFFYKYESEYYENWYYHSQWNYPQSARGISDGELYKFVGYRLVEGENPFNLNYEAPPFGKYLYGLSEKFTGNPYLITIGLYFFSTFLIYLLAKDLFREKRLALAAVLLFVTTPFVATQIKETMLDLPLMTFYLAHVVAFLRYMEKKNLLYLGLAGIFLGLASGTKLALYTPLALILGSILIFGKRLPFYWGSVVLGYIIAFTPYFLKHPNPIPWIRLHEKVITFYKMSQSTTDLLSEWKSIFFNSGKFTASDWSFILPIGTVVTFFIFYQSFKTREKKWLYISGISLIFLLINSLLFYWPRYLMPIIPLFILLAANLLRKKSVVIFLLAVLNLPFLFSNLSSDNPKGDFEASARFISTRAYRELYRSIDPRERKDLTEETFINTYESFLDKLDTKKVSVSVDEIKRSGDKATAPVNFKYQTGYGQLEHTANLEFVKMRGQWKMKLNWDYLWPGFMPGDQIVIMELNSQKKRKSVYIIPRVISDWGKTLSDLSQITTNNVFDVKDSLETVVPDKYPRFIGLLDESIDPGAIRVFSIPGISLRDDNKKADIYFQKNNGQKILIFEPR